MIRLASLAIFAFIFICSASLSQAAGFNGPGAKAPITRAIDVVSSPDGTPVVLEGRILEKLPKRKDCYQFLDKTGHVILEIGRKAFGQYTVTPDDLVVVDGVVDADGKAPSEVEVDFVRVIGPAPKTAE